jgi:uncharacterized RDD family membrane protein YckC
MKIAPVWKRIIAMAIDVCVFVAGFTLVILFLNWFLQLPVEYSLFEGRGLSVKMTDYVRENFLKIVVIYSLAKLSVIVPYFVLLESSLWQATIGKRILKIKVGDSDGNRISIGKAVLRLFGKWISGQILLIGYLMAFFTEKHRALHDFLAGTFVFEDEEKIK